MKDIAKSSLENRAPAQDAEIKEPNKSSRVVVSVAFPKNDFATVSGYAQHIGKKTSEFIRDAALEKAAGRSSYTQIYAFGNSGSLWLGTNLPSVTRVRTAPVEPVLNDKTLTSA